MKAKTAKTQNLATNAIPPYLTFSEVLVLAKVSRRTLERWVSEGLLTVYKVQGQKERRFLSSDVDQLLIPTPVEPHNAASAGAFFSGENAA